MFVLLIPQNISAINLYGSYEARGVFLQGHKIKIADSFSDIGQSPTLNFKPNYAYKVGLGMAFAEIFDVGLFYDEMWNQDQKHAGIFGSTYPLAGKHSEQGKLYDKADGLQSGSGSAKGNYGREIIDLEGGINLRFNPGIYFRLMIGVRYAKYKQDMKVIRGDECVDGRAGSSARCNNDGEPFGSERFLEQEIDGFGPRFGLSVIAPIKTTNLNIVGSFSYSILHARKDLKDNFSYIFHRRGRAFLEEEGNQDESEYYQIKETRKAKENSVVIADEDVTINIFDISGGLQYEMKMSKKYSIFLTGGYKYSIHYGALNTYGISLTEIKESDSSSMDTIKKVFGSSSGKKEDDFISYGPFVRVGFKF